MIFEASWCQTFRFWLWFSVDFKQSWKLLSILIQWMPKIHRCHLRNTEVQPKKWWYKTETETKAGKKSWHCSTSIQPVTKCWKFYLRSILFDGYAAFISLHCILDQCWYGCLYYSHQNDMCFCFMALLRLLLQSGPMDMCGFNWKYMTLPFFLLIIPLLEYI